MGKNILKWFMRLIIICILLVGCSHQSSQTNIEDQAIEIMELLVVKGDFQKIYHNYFSESLKKSMQLTDLVQSWEEHTETSGEYVDMGQLNLSEKSKSYVVAEIKVTYTDAAIDIRMTFNQMNRLVGLHISSDDVASHPDGIIEEEIVVGEGTSFELGGTLSLPKKYQKKLPAVILVHGSGPSDRDESVYAYKPFQDLAWGLAEQGIAVLRYDKRTFVYGHELSVDEMKKFTVYEETVEDAILAGELLKSDHRIDSRKIYVIGHSLGGMLAPRIATEGDVFSGIISLAGSPRKLWEIIYDQNIRALEDVTDKKERKRQKQKIEQQFKKAQQIGKMTTEEALEETVFGIPAHYFKEMDKYDAEKLALDLTIPIFILQGEDDFQVDMQKDFKRWQEILREKDNVTFKSYPGLNHFFVNYDGPNKGTIMEYNVPGSVDSSVISDIVDWILGNTS